MNTYDKRKYGKAIYKISMVTWFYESSPLWTKNKVEQSKGFGL
jgi:hypothetical protein